MDGMVDRQTKGLEERNSEARTVWKWMNYIAVTTRCPVHTTTFEEFRCPYSPIAVYPTYWNQVYFVH
jgi:hypothetical protein